MGTEYASPASHRQPRASLEDVARHAGVSLATASRALSGGRVRSEYRQRVEDAARLLGYRPNLAAQAVARGTTRTVALIVDYLRSPFGVEITRGVVDAASRHGLVVNVTGAETHAGDLLEAVAAARALRPRALILATGRVHDADIREDLTSVLSAYQKAGGAVAIVDGDDLPFASCSFDEAPAINGLVDHLVAAGYRRPLVLNPTSERSDLVGRTNSLLESLVRAGIPNDSLQFHALPTSESRRSLDDDLIPFGDADVVVCVEGSLVPAVYRSIRRQGKRVGVDVGVVTFGQYGYADALRPRLTAVDIPLRRAGALALEHALADTNGAHRALPCNLRIRASTPRRALDPAIPLAERQVTADVDNLAVIATALDATDLGTVARTVFDLSSASGVRSAIMSEVDFYAAFTPLRDGGRVPFDAVMLWGEVTGAMAQLVSAHGLRLVALGDVTESLGTNVSVDIAEGMQLTLEHLSVLGHREIAYVPDRSTESEAARVAGLRRFQLTHPEVVIYERPSGALRSEQTAPSVHDLLGDRVTAVVAGSDEAALGVVHALHAEALRVPEDVSVAGFGGSRVGRISVPSLTSARVDLAAATTAAWRLLVGFGPLVEPHSVSVPLLVGASTAPPSAQTRPANPSSAHGA